MYGISNILQNDRGASWGKPPNLAGHSPNLEVLHQGIPNNQTLRVSDAESTYSIVPFWNDPPPETIPYMASQSNDTCSAAMTGPSISWPVVWNIQSAQLLLNLQNESDAIPDQIQEDQRRADLREADKIRDQLRDRGVEIMERQDPFNRRGTSCIGGRSTLRVQIPKI